MSLEPPPWLEFTIRLLAGQRDAGQPAGHDPDVAPVVHRERAQVEVARAHAAVDERRRGRQRDRLLRDPPARVGEHLHRAGRTSSASVAAGPITSPLPPEPSTGLNTSWSRRASAHSHTSGSSSR